MEFFSSF